MAKTLIKQSVAYGYILSQPFATYIDAYPMLQSQWLAEQDIQLISYGDHSQIEQVIQAAKEQTGVRYQWGGTSPNGFDCSGFSQYVFQEQGISIPRIVSEIWNQSVDVNQPSVGDLVFFETYKKGPSHIGIYLGNDQFIHAGESSGVTTSSLNQDYWQTKYLGSRRISIE